MVSALVTFVYKRLGYSYILNAYSAVISLSVQYFILSQALRATKNLSEQLEADIDKAMAFLAVPLVSLPSLCIQNSFIKRGFRRQTLYSALYFPCVNIYATNLLAYIFNTVGTESAANAGSNAVLSESVRYTLGGVATLVLITLLDIYKNSSRFRSTNWRLGMYSIFQEYLITVYGLDKQN